MDTPIRTYIRYDMSGTDGQYTTKADGAFTGKAPRQAALKVANRGHPLILLREAGTKKIHVFTGCKTVKSKPLNAPAWMPDTVNVPSVKKVGTIRFKTLAELDTNLSMKVVGMIGA
jgi:hypothetical protein